MCVCIYIYIYLFNLYRQAHLRDVAGLVPDLYGKANEYSIEVEIVIKSQRFFGFSIHVTVMFILYYSLSQL